MLHENGDDPLLVVGDMVVSKTVMSLASPVKRAMLDRFWIENEVTAIPLPDDD